MGSPVSFPILCIVNAAASSSALGIGLKKLFSVQGSGFCVNGDDIAFCADREGIRRWTKAVSTIGLEPSLGKNYMDDRWLMINSERRVYSPISKSWSLHGFVNQALLRGLEIKGPNAGRDLRPFMIWTDLGSRARELVRGFEANTADGLLSVFVREHSRILKGCPAGIDWSFSEHLGGAGLPFSRPVGEFPKRCGSLIARLPVEDRESLIRVPRAGS